MMPVVRQRLPQLLRTSDSLPAFKINLGQGGTIVPHTTPDGVVVARALDPEILPAYQSRYLGPNRKLAEYQNVRFETGDGSYKADTSIDMEEGDHFLTQSTAASPSQEPELNTALKLDYKRTIWRQAIITADMTATFPSRSTGDVYARALAESAMQMLVDVFSPKIDNQALDADHLLTLFVKLGMIDFAAKNRLRDPDPFVSLNDVLVEDWEDAGMRLEELFPEIQTAEAARDLSFGVVDGSTVAGILSGVPALEIGHTYYFDRQPIETSRVPEAMKRGLQAWLEANPNIAAFVEP